jgi:hypothetical protein
MVAGMQDHWQRAFQCRALQDDPATARVRMVGAVVFMASALLFADITRDTTNMRPEQLTSTRVCG